LNREKYFALMIMQVGSYKEIDFTDADFELTAGQVFGAQS
jgi:hypothetical protein